MSDAGPVDVIILAKGDGGYVRRVVERLCNKGNPPQRVLFGGPVERILGKFQAFERARKRLGIWEAIRHTRRVLKFRLPLCGTRTMQELADRFGFPIEYFGVQNGGDLVLKVWDRGNTLLVLCGSGVVGRAVIDAARAGCLNAHPALLPGLRGVDVVEWALYLGHPLGISTHYVTAKVDAGDILTISPIEIRPEENFEGFKRRIVWQQADHLADAVLAIVQGSARRSLNDISQSRLMFLAASAVHERATRNYERMQQALKLRSHSE